MSDDSGSTLDPDKIPRRRGLHIRDIKEEAPEPEQTVGNELRLAREAAGKELKEVAAALRIKPEHLSALEAAEYDKLPAKTYVVGFVRQYAQQLGLDATELVERLKVELEGPQPEEEETPARGKPEATTRRPIPAKGPLGLGGGPSSRTEPESRLPVTSIAIVVVLLVIVIFGGWLLTRPSGDNNATADKEPETGSNSAPVVPEGRPENSGQRMPDPPVIPASADNKTGTARNGGSLTALLPGADQLAETDAAAGEPLPQLNQPDAAAMAVPIENTRGSGVRDDGVAVTEGEGDLAEAAMPQPKLNLRTERTDEQAGILEDAAGEPEGDDRPAGEPALDEIEAEGIGGAVSREEAPPPKPESQPSPEPVRAEETAVDSAATVQSRVTLRVRSAAWVRLEDVDGRVVMERDMRSGDSFEAPDRKSLYLATTDAGAIELLLDGQSIGRAGRPKQILTGLLLAPDQLKQHVAQSSAGPQVR